MQTIPTHDLEPFGNNYTLNTVMWLLVQHGKLQIDENPHFYTAETLTDESFDSAPKIDTLGMDHKLFNSRDLHVLVDKGCRLVIRTPDSRFYLSLGNIWWAYSGQHGSFRVVKRSPYMKKCRIEQADTVIDLNGTLEKTHSINKRIYQSNLRPKSTRKNDSWSMDNIWNNYLNARSDCEVMMEDGPPGVRRFSDAEYVELLFI